jgi:hypothetical protein
MEPLGEIIMSAKGLIEHKNALSVTGSNGDIARPALCATPRVGNKRAVKKLGTNVAKPAVPDRKLTQIAYEKILNAIVYGPWIWGSHSRKTTLHAPWGSAKRLSARV